MRANEIAYALGAKRNGRGWRARCPAHDDKNPSLDIAEGDDGKALFKCRAGCTQDAVLDALRDRGLWSAKNDTLTPSDWTPIVPVPADTPSPDFKKLLKSRPTDFWDYRSGSGQLLGYVARLDHDDSKTIIPLTWCRNGTATEWRMKALPIPRALYNLVGLAQRPSDPVLVVEGEKTAVAANEILEGHVSITWWGGCEGVSRADWSPLKGRDVTVWPDADAEGMKAAREVGDHASRAGAASVRIVKLPEGLPKGWDLADPIPATLDVEGLLASAEDVNATRLAGLNLINAADLVTTEFREPKWAVPGIIAEGASILAGRPKCGKSWLALSVAVAVASGTEALGNVECTEGDVLYLALEDTPRRLQGRLKAILQGDPAPRRLTITTEWRKADAGGLDDLDAWLTVHRDARLVIIDTLALIRHKPDRDAGVYRDDYQAITALKKLADKFTVPFVLIHHVRKETASDPLDMVSGTAGLTGSADTVMVLKHEPNDIHGELYVRGRDVHEQEFALEFDKDTGHWINLGDAGEHRMSEQRKEIVDLLRSTREAMTPAQIATHLGKKRTTVRSTLVRMRAKNEISQFPNGKYYCAT